MGSDLLPVLINRLGQNNCSETVEPKMKIRRANGSDNEPPAIIEVNKPCGLDVDIWLARFQAHLSKIIGQNGPCQSDRFGRAMANARSEALWRCNRRRVGTPGFNRPQGTRRAAKSERCAVGGATRGKGDFDPIARLERLDD